MMGPDIAYLYDGTLEGLLSAVFLSYERHEHPSEVVSQHRYQPRLAQESLTVTTDLARAWRVRRGIEHAAGHDAYAAILRASACDEYDAGTAVYRFIRYAMSRPEAKRPMPILDDLANPAVGDIVRLARRAANECEKMRQFVRFSHLENGIWYARCNPNASVVPLIMGHFVGRLNDQPFIIYDETHHLAGVYDGRKWQLVYGDASNVPDATDHDARMQEAWKRFYNALSVDARFNPELRRRFMPARLWQNLTEFQALQ